MSIIRGIPLVGPASLLGQTRFGELKDWDASNSFGAAGLDSEAPPAAMEGTKSLKVVGLGTFGAPFEQAGSGACSFWIKSLGTFTGGAATTDWPIMVLRNSTSLEFARLEYRPATETVKLLVGNPGTGSMVEVGTFGVELFDGEWHACAVRWSAGAEDVDLAAWIDPESPSATPDIQGATAVTPEAPSLWRAPAISNNAGRGYLFHSVVVWDEDPAEARAGRTLAAANVDAVTPSGSGDWGSTSGTSDANLKTAISDDDIETTYIEATEAGASVEIGFDPPSPLPAAIDGVQIWIPVSGLSGSVITIQGKIGGVDAGPLGTYVLPSSKSEIIHPIPGVDADNADTVSIVVTVASLGPP